MGSHPVALVYQYKMLYIPILIFRSGQCVSIVVLLDVDMLVVGGFGALGLRVTHLCPKCNSHREAGMPNVYTMSILKGSYNWLANLTNF